MTFKATAGRQLLNHLENLTATNELPKAKWDDLLYGEGHRRPMNLVMKRHNLDGAAYFSSGAATHAIAFAFAGAPADLAPAGAA